MVHRTSRGDPIDMDALRLKNEEVKAVGNMNVNARGDVLATDDVVIATRAKQAGSHYQKQTSSSVRDTPVVSSKAAVVKDQQAVVDEIIGLEEELVHEVTNKDMEAVIEKVEKTTSGLAGAIAKAKEVKQEQLKTQAEEERSGDGVKKI